MIQMTNAQQASLARSLVNAASQKNLTLRVIGGAAIYLTCASIETHPSLQRKWQDVDFVALRKEWSSLADLFAQSGIAPKRKEQSSWLFDKEGVEIELTSPDFHDGYMYDISTRLALASPCVTLADLLLIKLQRRTFEIKDVQDSIALLLDHRVSRGEAEEQIDRTYIAKLCARNWSLFHTIYDNTVMLESVLDKYLELEEAQLVWRRIELLQGDMDEQPKSFIWMLNQIIRRPTQVPA